MSDVENDTDFEDDELEDDVDDVELDPDSELDNDAALADVDYDDDDDEDEMSGVRVSGSLLSLEFEDRPKSDRRGRSSIPEIEWENLPEFAMIKENPGRDARILVFKGDHARGRAISRARQIRLRFFSHRPLELWDISHRLDSDDGSYKVYAKFVRPLTVEESNERIAKHREASERLAKAREQATA